MHQREYIMIKSILAVLAGIPLALVILLLALIATPFITGCAGQSAVQQIAAQTDDPGTIALAAFADAQDAYIAAAELYAPYRNTLAGSNPDLDAAIVSYLRMADKILTDWERYGDVPVDDKMAFRAYLREISIEIAKYLEKKSER